VTTPQSRLVDRGSEAESGVMIRNSADLAGRASLVEKDAVKPRVAHSGSLGDAKKAQEFGTQNGDPRLCGRWRLRDGRATLKRSNYAYRASSLTARQA